MTERPPQTRPSRPYWLVLLIVALAVGVLVYGLSRAFPDAARSDDAHLGLVYNVVLLVGVGSSVIVGYRLRAGTMLRHALAWIGIACVLLLAYSFRGEVRNLGDRIYGELRPDRALVQENGTLAIRRSADGHFRLTATVDGKAIRFLVDTGATLVALSPDDARRLGFDPAALRYGMRTETANGTTWSAPVMLATIRVGPVRVDRVAAAVSRDGLGESLLGLSFLNRLAGYEVRGDTMILRP